MSETKAEDPSVTSDPVVPMPPSLPASSPSMKDGEEPLELLLELASYDLLTLYNRKAVEIVEGTGSHGEPVVAVIFHEATWNNGIVMSRANG